MPSERQYTVTEAAEVLEVTTQTIYGWINSGEIAAVKRMGKPYLIPDSEIQRALKPIT